MTNNQKGFTLSDFWERDHVQVRFKATLHLLTGAAFVFFFVLFIWPDKAEFYDYLTAVSIGVTLMISTGYWRGLWYQADKSIHQCCDKAGRSVALVLSLIILLWLILFFSVIQGAYWNKASDKIVFNIFFAILVYSGYVWIDRIAYKSSFDKECGQKKRGLAADVKRSFWQVDGPTLGAILLFTVVVFLLFPKFRDISWATSAFKTIDSLKNTLPKNDAIKLQSNIELGIVEAQTAFVQGGLALLMLTSSFAFGLGFPKYVLSVSREPLYEQDVCSQVQNNNKTAEVKQQEDQA